MQYEYPEIIEKYGEKTTFVDWIASYFILYSPFKGKRTEKIHRANKSGDKQNVNYEERKSVSCIENEATLMIDDKLIIRESTDANGNTVTIEDKFRAAWKFYGKMQCHYWGCLITTIGVGTFVTLFIILQVERERNQNTLLYYGLNEYQ